MANQAQANRADLPLDTQLRNMILGNVQINESHQPQRGRGRGRGRGGHRGRYGGNHPQQSADHGEGHGNGGQRGDPSTTPSRGAFRGDINVTQAGTPHRGRGQGRGHGRGQGRGRGGHHGSGQRFTPPSSDQLAAQTRHLEDLAGAHIPQFEMSAEEFETKDLFRRYLQDTLQQAVIHAYPDDPPLVTLHIFGSLSSGFAKPGSDMDLALQSSVEQPDIFRVFQKVLLDRGIGARLLTRTRVPILKICSAPPDDFMKALRDDREAWDNMTPEERIAHDNGAPTKKVDDGEDKPSTGPRSPQTPTTRNASSGSNTLQDNATQDSKATPKPQKTWHREKRRGPLDFPPGDVGIQCDINYANPLGLHNTQLLRCYSACDIRVRLMVLFIKGWASRRKINSSYNGTLSSYGYVLMVLHYLTNVASPPVCPNLQLKVAPVGSDPAPEDLCLGYDVRFWRDQHEIARFATRGAITNNREPLGSLLRGFFLYYGQQGSHVPRGGFSWTQQVLSLRHPNGIVWKSDKGWTNATTVEVDGKEVRNRYLLAIEDPFEISHNVARTVTHNGIVAIRDELRRAWRLICDSGGGAVGEDLMEAVVDLPPEDAEKEQEATAGQSTLNPRHSPQFVGGAIGSFGPRPVDEPEQQAPQEFGTPPFFHTSLAVVAEKQRYPAP